MSPLAALWGLLFGGGRNVVAETMGVFRENAEAAGVRDAEGRAAALAQFSAEFGQPRRGLFDRAIDGLNRMPRPLMAYGVLGLFVTAMTDPVWFASRMQGLALVPEPLWWLMGAIVSFYFGARYQSHSQEFQRSVAETMARVPEVAANIGALRAMESDAPTEARTVEAPSPRQDETAALGQGGNPALAAWAGGR
ncbi:holin family protein [Wenxinia marina]|uniref:Holin of 3TMs, for gene-transfer release n=1 Tax=Wenxinia marina DSM 24838 TaxID=1123501 RepID=A0A0D0QD49_9RHOB|nr:holin family protein [Wenxinia marina]KIQ68938.1 hypothetical protein Wenmar_02670 [Wenxinia marina DSM 24838]GGL63960.1 hypothetical protein GCM10011392_18330 [Wenxinia marina]